MRDRLIAWILPYVGETLAPILIPDQPVLSTLGGILGVIIAVLWARREGVLWWKALLVAGGAVLVALGMARVFWAIIHYDYILADPMIFLDPYKGGAVSFGALFGATVGGVLTARILKAPMWRLADTSFPASLVGIAFARVGCLMRACDYGVRSELPWAFRYPPTSSVWRRHLAEGWLGVADPLSDPVHPFPLYLSVWAIAVFLLVWLKPRLFGVHPGQRAMGAGILWLAGRFVIEFLRQAGNAPMVLGPINLGQALAVAGIVVFIGIHVSLGRRPAQEGTAAG